MISLNLSANEFKWAVTNDNVTLLNRVVGFNLDVFMKAGIKS